jgi:hypothetical protein
MHAGLEVMVMIPAVAKSLLQPLLEDWILS